MYASTQENLSSVALNMAAHALPDLKAFSNDKDFNDLYKGNHTFVSVRYQDKTGDKRLVVRETKFMMDVEKLEEFRTAIERYHGVLRAAQIKAADNYQDFIVLEEGEWFDRDNYFYFQRVGTDLGFAHIYASETNAFLRFLEGVKESYFSRFDFDEEGELPIDLYHLLKENGKYVLGNHAGERVDCQCWMSFGQCRHALLHVVKEAAYDTAEEAVTALVAKSAGMPKEKQLLLVTDEKYAVLMKQGEVVSQYTENEGSDRCDELWSAHKEAKHDLCYCDDDHECDFCLEEQCYEEPMQNEGPHGGAFVDEFDFARHVGIDLKY